MHPSSANGTSARANGPAEFTLRVGFPLKDDDNLKHPIAYQPKRTKLNLQRQRISKRMNYAEQFKFASLTQKRALHTSQTEKKLAKQSEISEAN